MATSNDIEFNMDRTDFIKWALHTSQLVGVEQDIPENLINHCKTSLNMVLASWDTRFRYLWKEQNATVFLQPNQTSYSLGTSGDHAANDVVQTTLSADEATGQTVLSITSSTGISASDYIGITLDDNSLFWTTVVSTGVGTVTVTNSLTSAASSGNIVYAYTTRLARPLRIMNAQTRTNGETDRVVDIMARDDYNNLPNKFATTTNPVKIYYDPKTNTAGKLYVWPTPVDSLQTLQISYQRSLQIFSDANDDADLPKQYYLPLAFELASVVAPAIGKDNKAKSLLATSQQYLVLANMGDREESSTFIGPNFNG